jgi:hypothetical protein
MRQIALTESQKGVVRRYVEVWRRWRPDIRSFAELERDIENGSNGSKVLVDGITVDDRAELPVPMLGIINFMLPFSTMMMVRLMT